MGIKAFSEYFRCYHNLIMAGKLNNSFLILIDYLFPVNAITYFKI